MGTSFPLIRETREAPKPEVEVRAAKYRITVGTVSTAKPGHSMQESTLKRIFHASTVFTAELFCRPEAGGTSGGIAALTAIKTQNKVYTNAGSNPSLQDMRATARRHARVTVFTVELPPPPAAAAAWVNKDVLVHALDRERQHNTHSA